MSSPLLKDDLPENALVNVRGEIGLYFGASNKIDDRLIDSLIDSIVKQIYRRYDFSWKKVYVDTAIPYGTGVLPLPSNFKKIWKITNQSNEPTIVYTADKDYILDGYNNQSPPVRQIRWVSPPGSEDLDVRIHYYKTMTRAKGDTDLVDVPAHYIDLVRLGVIYLYSGQKGNIDEYDRFKADFDAKLQEMIDDDTRPDISANSTPLMADNTEPDYSEGEIA